MSNELFSAEPIATNPSPPAPRGWGAFWIVLAVALGGMALLPFCCCGGLLFWSSMFTDFTLSNGEHLGGSPMNIEFDYEMRDTSRGPLKAYTIVVRSADGTRRERPIGGGFIDRRGTMRFQSFEIGPQTNLRGPVKVWIESSDAFGRSRSTASNTLTIRTKSR